MSFMKSGLRLLLVGVNQRLWYLGERVLSWNLGPSSPQVPALPPCSIFLGQRLKEEKLSVAISGFPAIEFTVDKPYVDTTFLHLAQ